jgi:hypothetical protein
MKIPSYKYTNSVIQVYKFKPIFKKIGQTKALYLFYVLPRIFTLLLFYLNGESKKQTHLCRTIELSDYRAVGLTGCRIIATLPFKIVCDFIVQFRIVRIYLSELSSFTITYFNVSNNLNFRARISK